MSQLCSEPLSQIQPVPVRWLWEPVLPRGKLAVLDGNPGVGKSLITIDLAARLSRGVALPGGAPSGRPHVTLLVGTEDNTADTVRPRAEAAGADLDRVHIVSSADPVRFPAHVPELEGLIRERSADLVVIDPFLAFLPPEAAANLDQCVRRALTPLAALAERTDCAVLLVRHLRKHGAGPAVHRGQGSVGIIAAARVGLLAARHPEDPGRGVLAVAKANAAGPVPSLAYRVRADRQGRPAVVWTEELALPADRLRDPAMLRSRDRAVEWLHGRLAAGPCRAADLYAAAAGTGIPDRTLERAKKELGVKSHRVFADDRAEWWWFDPSAPWPAGAPFKKPGPRDLPELDLW
jgi:hypothetical protein